MKLNSDCIRSVMLALEKLLTIESDDRGNLLMIPTQLNSLCRDLPNYTKEDIFYTLHNLEQAGYIDLNAQYADGGILIFCEVDDITFAGHEFLNEIRDDKQWTAVKSALAKVKSYSLSAISSIAEGMTKAAIDKYIASST